jgi:CBS domain-containing protein
MDVQTLRSTIQSLNPAPPICVPVGTSVHDAIQRMARKKIGCLCIVRDGLLAGILTERDILTKVAGTRMDPRTSTVDEIMTPDPEYLLRDDMVAFALNRMHVGGFRHVPLLDLEGKPVGVITVKDIVARLAESFEGSNT